MTNAPLRFEYIPYPLWRRKMPLPARVMLEPLFRSVYPVSADRHPPDTPDKMAQWLARWKLFGENGWGIPENVIARQLASSNAPIAYTERRLPERAADKPVRVPAQWETMESVLISWAWMYPPLWAMHAQMVEGISPVCPVEIIVPTAMWAHAVWVYLSERDLAQMDNVRFLVLPTNDIWIRDYGPIIGLDDDGQQVAVNPIYDPLPNYPQHEDNGMVRRWSAYREMSVRDWNMHTEGGNLWSDGQGTLIMSEQIFYSNRYHDRDSILKAFHDVFHFEKAIITPRMTLEETGHVDLLVKLADAQTVFVSAATSLTTGTALRKARQLLEKETNAAGQPYNIVPLPTPPLYLNWIFYTIRRGYTNSLTVNGRVLVPVFGVPEDEQALRIYAETMPDYDIIPIDCKVAINGGGAVHCMTREVPAAGG